MAFAYHTSKTSPQPPSLKGPQASPLPTSSHSLPAAPCLPAPCPPWIFVLPQVRIVQKLTLRPLEKRLEAIEEAGYNTFLLQVMMTWHRVTKMPSAVMGRGAQAQGRRLGRVTRLEGGPVAFYNMCDHADNLMGRCYPAMLDAVQNNDVFLDMLTDSGVNAMSDQQQASGHPNQGLGFRV